MMSIPHTPGVGTPVPATSVPLPNVRPRVTTEPLPTGHVDGAWWPCSRDLAAELPELLDALGSQWGPWERVTYNLTMWEPVARGRLVVDGHRIRAEGFHSQRPETVTVIGDHGRCRLTLLVVPPEAFPASARASLADASQRGDPAEMAMSTQRRELDGGRVR
ncbi:DUF5994 family protein [Prauserella alba]|uniref:DUF5994 family protein n=1 Tax=Prauserella alba TaxID=176898 RepID=A0ABN1V7M0_9PSEU|nr:DUF5994 family protein [Prauserella alba]MCP2181277.1 hypothetical protein [Prauserella alba]